MRKIESGVYGLNTLLDGGINERSAVVVIGAAGAGKTTFAAQFLRKGLDMGQPGIFISLDENKDQIIHEAVEMGWHKIRDYLKENQLLFINASGKRFSEFIREDLPAFIEDWKGSNARIVVDPLTPVIWAIPDRYRQRELIAALLRDTRKIGTVLCTLEEHGMEGDLSGRETIIPMYLADCVIYLRYRGLADREIRTLKIIKCRNSRHSKLEHPYRILKGLGIIVQQKPFVQKMSKNIPQELRRAIRANNTIPKHIQADLLESLAELCDTDFEGLDVTEVISSIVNEHTTRSSSSQSERRRWLQLPRSKK
jgi:KaiC/GvpD/RAD55 family RecA-like ATPase